MDRSAVILAGGSSTRFGQHKELFRLANKPLIRHVIDRVCEVVDEIIVVTSSLTRKRTLDAVLDPDVTVAVDKHEAHGPLIGALTGFEHAHGEYALLLPCDTPFVSTKVASILLDRCASVDAVVPRWPNGFVEPLHATYRTHPAWDAINRTVQEDQFDFQSMLSNLRRVHYLPTSDLQQVDPELLTFLNVNRRADLHRAEGILAKHKQDRRSFEPGSPQ